MKIEKLSDNQIRCTLTGDDLEARKMKLSELAYGTPKAKKLFSEIVSQAAAEVGFDASNGPIMIEAVPMSDEVVMLVTRVDDPEELDTRFSRFAPGIVPDDDDNVSMEEIAEGLGELFDFFAQLQSAHDQLVAGIKAAEDEARANAETVTALFATKSMRDLIKLAAAAGDKICAESVLYRDTDSGQYYLAARKGDLSLDDFNCRCNALSEYCDMQKCLPAGRSFMDEHYEVVIADHAIEKLAQLG